MWCFQTAELCSQQLSFPRLRDWESVQHLWQMSESTGRQRDHCAFNRGDTNQVRAFHFFRLIDVRILVSNAGASCCRSLRAQQVDFYLPHG